MGKKAAQIDYIGLAHAKGLGESDYKKLKPKMVTG